MTATPPSPNQSRFSRRKFLACAGLAGLGFAGYSSLIAPFQLEVGQHDFTTHFPQPKNPIRLLHLSDLHASWAVSLDFISRAIELGLSLRPDVICVTGDFVTSQYANFPGYARVLSRLSDVAPTFASLGNHDGGLWAGRHGGYADTRKVRELLLLSRINLLANRWATMRIKGRNLRFIGLQDVWSEPLNGQSAFSRVDAPSEETRIVLSHNPDSKDMIRFNHWDLLLCGHTHGGQAVFPLLGPGFFAPVNDKRFIAGMLPWENRWIHITRGVGNVHGLRFNCPPEVSLITLV